MANTAIATVDDVIARINARFASEKPAGGFADATSYAATKATVDAASPSNGSNTLVQRNPSGDITVGRVYAAGTPPVGAGELTRKDYVDTQVATRVAVSLVGANNGVATLDSAGKIPTSQLPPLAINDVFTAASQAAMLALTAQIGDMARRTDFTPNRMYVLTTNSPTTLADWVEINAAGSVTSVDGQTGTVSLGSAGLGASTLARRTSTGQLIAADATGVTELVTLGQLQTRDTAIGLRETITNTDLVRNRVALFETAPILRRIVRLNFSMLSGQFTLIPLDGGDRTGTIASSSNFDTLGNQWTSATPDRCICRRTGWYHVDMGYALNTASTGRMFIKVAINGNDQYFGQGNGRDSVPENGVHTSFDVFLTSGDYMTFIGYQDSGATLATSDSPYASGFMNWHWLRP